jgi:flagellar basal body-associated protein FliL
MAEAELTSSVEDGVAPKPKSLLKKLKVAGILAAIVLAQCFVVYVWLPAGEERSAHASVKTEATTHESAHHEATQEQTEVDLGAFSLTVFNPNTNNNLLIDFHLFGTVTGAPLAAESAEKPEKVEEGDAAKLESLLKKNRHRFRDQVIVTIRNSQIADLTDPGLGLIKRQILAKTNTLLGEPLVKEVVFSDFVVVEQ